jgi:hypothetical protein
MKTLELLTLKELRAFAKINNTEVYETDLCYSFRTFKPNGNTDVFYVYYK